MSPFWRETSRHFAQVVLFCGVVAVFTTIIWPNHSYWVQWAQALGIGLVCWAVIEFGRYLVDERHCHRSSVDGGHGWPKGWRGFALSATGIAAGFLIGNPLCNRLLGIAAPRSGRDQWVGLAITVAAGTVATFYFHARGKAAALEASRNAAERDASEWAAPRRW